MSGSSRPGGVAVEQPEQLGVGQPRDQPVGGGVGVELARADGTHQVVVEMGGFRHPIESAASSSGSILRTHTHA